LLASFYAPNSRATVPVWITGAVFFEGKPDSTGREFRRILDEAYQAMRELRRPFCAQRGNVLWKVGSQLAEKVLYATMKDFFRQHTSDGGMDGDEAKTMLHEMVEKAFEQVVAERRRSFRIVN
jgi:hypothetical protein